GCKPNSFSCRRSAWIAGSSPAMTNVQRIIALRFMLRCARETSAQIPLTRACGAAFPREGRSVFLLKHKLLRTG
ncbi:MAG: hypothetical protein WA280_15905, partial [Xanthobacteraceae bacterium]